MSILAKDEEIPFLSPATAPVQDPVAENDEEEYSTLVKVKEILDEGIINLSKDFNAFDLAKDAITLETQIAGRQVAYNILIPIQNMVDSAIIAVKNGRKG